MIYNFTRYNANNGGAPIDLAIDSHATILPWSEIAVCLETGSSTEFSDRVFSLGGQWNLAKLNAFEQTFDSDGASFIKAYVPDLTPTQDYFDEEIDETTIGYVYEREFDVYNLHNNYFLTFSKIIGDFEVYVNGVYVGASTVFNGEFDVTKFVHEGKNTLLVRVTKSALGEEIFEENSPVGVYGDVVLSMKGSAYLRDYSFSCVRDGLVFDGTLTLNCVGDGAIAEVVFADGEEIIAEENAEFVDGVCQIKLVGEYKGYTAETPYTYDAYVRIIQNDSEKECVKITFGFSPNSVNNDAFCVDFTDINLKGVVYSPALDADYGDELAILKSFNVNAVYLNAPVRQDFFRVCEEIGLYVFINVPFGRKTSLDGKKRLQNKNVDYAEHIALVASYCVNATKNSPCVLGYSFGSLPSTQSGKEILVALSEKYGKGICGVNFSTTASTGEVIKPVIAVAPADKITADGLQTLVFDKEYAGVFVDNYRDGEKAGLFDGNNVATDKAEIVKYAYRPYNSYLADNRTLVIENNKAFTGSDNLTVSIYLVDGENKELIQKIQPVIAPNQAREYGVYLGTEEKSITVVYETDGEIIAIENAEYKKPDLLPEYMGTLVGKSYNYKVVNKEFNVNKIEENALEARSEFTPCSGQTVCAMAKASEESKYSDRVFSLSGEWDFAFYKENAPVNFGGESMKWDKITLPNSWESAGYEEFKYSYGYAFKENFKKFTIGEKNNNKNSVGLYRKFINVADVDHAYVLSFTKVNGSLELQINGKYVGYSMLGSAEFNVTDYLEIGENEIVVIVKKWTPTSYLYGLDGFNASGIIGEVKLLKHRKDGLFDIDVKTNKLAEGYQAEVTAKFFTDVEGKCKIELKRGEETLYETIAEKDGDVVKVIIEGDFLSYNEETLVSYDLYVKTIEKSFVTECTRVKVGFNEIAILNDVATYNDQPIKVKGVIYNPVYNGQQKLLTISDIKSDLALIKEYGFNAVRPINYVPAEFYAICQEIGLFVIDDAKINTSVAGLKKDKLRNAVIAKPEFKQIIEKTVLKEFIRNKNAFSRIAFVISENADLKAIDACISNIRLTSDLPVICYGGTKSQAYVSNYPTLNGVLDAYNLSAYKKPVFFAEYASAVGVGCASMHEYNELFTESPCCMGGCVAYFTDDVINGIGRKANGLFTAQRKPYVGAESIKYLYRKFVSTVTDNNQKIEIKNLYKYTKTDDLSVKISVVSEGKVSSVTTIDTYLEPSSSQVYDLFLGTVSGNMLVEVEYVIKSSGKTILKEQHILSEELKPIVPKRGYNPMGISYLFDYVDVAFDCGTVRFNKKIGGIVRYTLGKKEILRTDSVQKGGNCFVSNIYRPFIRNLKEKQVKIDSKLRDFEVEDLRETGCVHVNIEKIFSINGKESYIVQDKYIVSASGAIEVFSVITPLRRGLGNMDCFGKQIRFNNAFNNVVYYGNGESYIDVCEHTCIDVYEISAKDVFDNTSLLQECGNRTNVRYAVVRDKEGDGVVISVRKAPYQLRVSPYSDEEIAQGYKTGVRPEQSGVYVDVNAFVSGIGMDNGGNPLAQYSVPPSEYVLHFDFIPTSAK